MNLKCYSTKGHNNFDGQTKYLFEIILSVKQNMYGHSKLSTTLGFHVSQTLCFLVSQIFTFSCFTNICVFMFHKCLCFCVSQIFTFLFLHKYLWFSASQTFVFYVLQIFVKHENLELCVFLSKSMFHQETSVETIEMIFRTRHVCTLKMLCLNIVS